MSFSEMMVVHRAIHHARKSRTWAGYLALLERGLA